MKKITHIYSNPKQAVLPILIQDYLDICDPVLTISMHIIIIVLDFTEKYKSKYPNASVRGAKIQCFLSAIE